jgi:hypothetical protein
MFVTQKGLLILFLVLAVSEHEYGNHGHQIALGNFRIIICIFIRGDLTI